MNTPYIALTLVALWIGEQRRDILPGQPLPVETAPADIEQLLRLGAISADTNTSEAGAEEVSGNGAASDTAAPDSPPAAAEASATDGEMETSPAGGKANPRKRTKS